MYFPATKVKVLASSITKHGAALRKGSLGYIANLGGGVYSPTKPLGMSIPYVLTPGHLVVTRFGNETKRRSEIKPVIYVIPVKLNNIGNKYFNNVAALLSDAQQYAGLITKDWKDNGILIKNPPFIVAVPTTEELDVTCNDHELVSWTFSAFASILFRSVLDKGYISKGSGAALSDTLSKYLQPQQEFEWCNYFVYQKEIRNLINNFTAEKRKDFITFIQGQRSIYIRSYLNSAYAIVNGTADNIYALRTCVSIDLNSTHITGLHNLKDVYSIQTSITLAWLDVCYRLNSHKGGITQFKETRKDMRMWLDRITTFK